MTLYSYQVEALVASAKNTAQTQLKNLPLRNTLKETLLFPFRSLPLPIKYLNAILLTSTVIHISSLGDYLQKVVFRHAPLPDLLAEERDALVAFNTALNEVLKNAFPGDYEKFIGDIQVVNSKAEWFDKSNPYWISHEG